MEPSEPHSLRLLNNLHHLPYGLSIAVKQRGYLYRCHRFTFIYIISIYIKCRSFIHDTSWMPQDRQRQNGRTNACWSV